MELNISLPAAKIFSIGPVAITNGHLAAFVVTGLLCWMAVWANKRMGVVPSKFQAFIELPFEFVRNQLTSAFGSKEKGDKFLPLVMTYLLFIAVANQFSLIPFVTNFTLNGDAVLRTPTSDLGQTAALALIVMAISWYLALTIAPFKFIGNFIKIEPLLKVRSLKQLGPALLDFFLGFMDIVGELAKYVALAARLFGNVFAGEVMVAVIAGLSIWTMAIVPIPFYVLSIFSGLVQSLVFILLTTQFIAMTVASVESPSEAQKDTGIIGGE